MQLPVKKLVGAGLAAAIVLGGGAAAWAYERPAGPTLELTAAHAGKAGKVARAGNPLGRAVGGTVTVKDASGTYVTLTFDRGKVTAASATSITITRADGKVVTKTIDASTTFTGLASATDLKVGKAALVLSDGDTATKIVQRAKHAKTTSPSTTTPGTTTVPTSSSSTVG